MTRAGGRDLGLQRRFHGPNHIWTFFELFRDCLLMNVSMLSNLKQHCGPQVTYQCILRTTATGRFLRILYHQKHGHCHSVNMVIGSNLTCCRCHLTLGSCLFQVHRKQIKEKPSSMEQISKWQQGWRVTKWSCWPPHQHLMNINTPMDNHTFFLVYTCPNSLFLLEGGEIPENNFKGAYRYRPFRLQGKRSPQFPMSPCIVTIFLFLS